MKVPLLDLHGFKTEDVTLKVDQFLTKTMGQGCDSVKIMTGKGSGKVKMEVIKYLKLGGYPWKYEKQSNGHDNEGVLIVFLE